MTFMHRQDEKQRAHRWYHEPFVWMLIAIPLAAVIGGFVTLGLAVSSDDGLVQDDYYRHGKEINRVLARDQAAATRGLHGRVELDDATQRLLIRLVAREPASIPADVEIRFLHATRAGIDRIIILPRQADGAYAAPLPALAPGHWNVQLAAQDWRLVGSLRLPGERGIDIRPALP
jgi:hypothetical protein